MKQDYFVLYLKQARTLQSNPSEQILAITWEHLNKFLQKKQDSMNKI